MNRGNGEGKGYTLFLHVDCVAVSAPVQTFFPTHTHTHMLFVVVSGNPASGRTHVCVCVCVLWLCSGNKPAGNTACDAHTSSMLCAYCLNTIPFKMHYPLVCAHLCVWVCGCVFNEISASRQNINLANITVGMRSYVYFREQLKMYRV